MKDNINIKKIIIYSSIVIIIIGALIGIKFGINAIILNKELKNAEKTIIVKDDVKMYSSANTNKKYEKIELGTDAYVLKRFEDKDNELWCKVKIGNKVGYVLEKNIGKYNAIYGKKNLMLDVSKFNLQNNFKNIGEFKAFILNNNIKFVYIRAGGRGYGQAGNMYTDPQADEYAKACEYLEIPFGYYFLDEAMNSTEIDEEVEFITNYINEHQYKNNTLPIALDVEKHAEKGRADDIWETRYMLINELSQKLKDKNERVILYGNASYANQYLTQADVEMWLAYYPKIKDIPDYWYNDTNGDGANNDELIKKMVGWQFTEEGVKGKIDKKVDISIVYSNYFLNGSIEDIEKDIKERKEMVFGPLNDLKNKAGYDGQTNI